MMDRSTPENIISTRPAGADPGFYVRRGALLGEGSGDRLGPHRVQGFTSKVHTMKYDILLMT